MTQLYYSREDRIGEINEEEDRVSYVDPEADYNAAIDPVLATGQALEELDECVADFFDEVENGSQESIKKAREELVYQWALAQVSLSKVAWVLRIDGNGAYQELIEAIKGSRTANMEGM